MAALTDVPMKPMIFGTRSILAWQAGAKTQTRRLVKPQPTDNQKLWQDDEGRWWWWERQGAIGFRLSRVRQPYAVGTLVWIREALCRSDSRIVVYQADHTPAWFEGAETRAWSWDRDRLPGMFMPKWACRYYGRVTERRPERLQEISDEDAVAEGVLVGNDPMIRYSGQYHGWYMNWWDSLHTKPGTRSEHNPWVWRYGVEEVTHASTE